MKRILLAPNPYRDKGLKTALSAQKILSSMGTEPKLCMPFEMDRNCELPGNIQLFDINKELPNSDLLICFGGDGTILHVSKLAAHNNIPILGVNVGNIGFMAELESSELPLLKNIIEGDFSLDERLMLDISVIKNGKEVYSDLALNDAVVTKGAVARVINLGVSCDGEEVSRFSGDGVIICTPTGSTAYSMSAGGPIVEPSAKNLIVTPICAHDLHTKSFVLSGERLVTVRIKKNARKTAYLSVDGGRAIKLGMGDYVTVKKSDYKTRLVRIKKLSFYSRVNQKF